MPRTLHADLAQAAEREGTSLNQYITAALATKVGAGPDEHRSGSNQSQSRVIAVALVANAVVIGLAAVAAIAVLVVALLG
jgi:multisubunit Na+/H+ antiporter MnhC subunit